MNGVRWAAAALALLVLAACGDGEGGGSALGALGVKDGASRGVSKSVEASPDKDVRIELSTGALLAVPKGAVDKALTVTMERPADSKALDLVQRFKSDQDRIVSAPYVLKPHGTMFNEEVTVTLPLSKTSGRDEVEVAWLEDEKDTEWKKLGVAKADGKSAQITLKHFSVLVLVEDASDLRVVDVEPQPDAGNASADDAGGEADAGNVAPDMDASISVPVDPGVGPDAGAQAGLDAVVPGLADAGAQLDAGAELDGFVPIDPDADSGATQLPDATVFVDAAAPPLTGQVVAARIYDRLLQCGLVAATGAFSRDVAPNSREACHQECLSRGTCDEAYSVVCPSVVINDGGGNTPAVVSCIEACDSFLCPDQTGATRCNEIPECVGGEDEQDCGGVFKCGAETISWWLRCNTYVDCLDGSDEQGCFSCDADATRLRPEQVCDTYQDCTDQADEANCATISACPPPPG